jgi:hypothetical protein
VRKLDAIGVFYGAKWSPDSRQLLISARIRGRCSALWRVSVDSSARRLVSSCY